tara:strand:- start:2263 stop:2595 length:333 start_codon:yes stop_codon:yes gene_type:complete
MSQKPIDQINAGNGIRADIWRNVTDDGKEFFNTTISRRYRDKEGEWHDTNVFGRDDLPKLAVLANMSFERIITRQYSEKAEKAQPELVNGDGEGFVEKEKARRKGTAKEK